MVTGSIQSDGSGSGDSTTGGRSAPGTDVVLSAAANEVEVPDAPSPPRGAPSHRHRAIHSREGAAAPVTDPTLGVMRAGEPMRLGRARGLNPAPSPPRREAPRRGWWMLGMAGGWRRCGSGRPPHPGGARGSARCAGAAGTSRVREPPGARGAPPPHAPFESGAGQHRGGTGPAPLRVTPVGWRAWGGSRSETGVPRAVVKPVLRATSWRHPGLRAISDRPATAPWDRGPGPRVLGLLRPHRRAEGNLADVGGRPEDHACVQAARGGPHAPEVTADLTFTE